MLSILEAGWCKLRIGDFVGIPSYITDVPVDLLTAFINYYKKGIGAAYFDEEGTEFNLLLSDYSIYIIQVNFEGKPILRYFPDVNVDDLAKELFIDINSNIDSWSRFGASINSKYEILQERELLINLISELKGMIIHYA